MIHKVGTILWLFLFMGVLITSGLCSRARSCLLSAHSQSVAGAEQEPGALDFKEMMTGESRSTNGAHDSFHSWKATDGIVVSSRICECDSVVQAKKAFLKRLSES